MQAHMMQQPLLVSSLLRHAERHHGDQQVVSRGVDGGLHRYSFRDLARRARQLAAALGALGLERGDRVGTLAWNGHRHLELYYAVSGAGAVLHTLNPRLHADQLAWIAEHADDRALFFDPTFLPLVEALAPRLPGVRHFVLMGDRAQLPADCAIGGLLCYEDLIAAHDDTYAWPLLDENAASSLCYTSGTTGDPKGVLFSHRSTLLHTFASALPDTLNVSAADCVLPVVPMFHVNAWGLPYAACMVGAKLVLPGPQLDGASLYALFESEGVTLSAGVPTVWQGLLAHVRGQGLRFTSMRRTIVGGAACPPRMLAEFEDELDVRVLHAWGMTELSPIGTVSAPRRNGEPAAHRRAQQAKQGRCPFGVDMRVVDAAGAELPWDGRSAGELQVRGHWVVQSYFGGASPLADGWFPTGDVAHIDAEACMQITDRAKDVIKSGGEWIGSIEIENIAMAHPAVAMAACIAARHPKWDERPLLIVVRKPGAELTRAELLQFFAGRIAKWWTPDDVIFTESIPLGATGKMLKHLLRAQYQDHLLCPAN